MCMYFMVPLDHEIPWGETNGLLGRTGLPLVSEKKSSQNPSILGIVFQPFSTHFSKKGDGFPAFPASIRTGKQTMVLGMQEEPKKGG